MYQFFYPRFKLTVGIVWPWLDQTVDKTRPKPNFIPTVYLHRGQRIKTHRLISSKPVRPCFLLLFWIMNCPLSSIGNEGFAKVDRTDPFSTEELLSLPPTNLLPPSSFNTQRTTISSGFLPNAESLPTRSLHTREFPLEVRISKYKAKRVKTQEKVISGPLIFFLGDECFR